MNFNWEGEKSPSDFFSEWIVESDQTRLEMEKGLMEVCLNIMRGFLIFKPFISEYMWEKKGGI